MAHWALKTFVLACGVFHGSTVAAQQPRPQSQATPEVELGEAVLVADAWALYAKGDLAGASGKADKALAVAPRSMAALAVALEIQTTRGAAAGALDFYERWLGQRELEEPAALRHIARALLREAAQDPADSAARFEARRALIRDGDRSIRSQLQERIQAGDRAESRLLAELGDERAVQMQIEALNAPGSPLRAIEALGQSGDSRAAAAIAGKLEDPRSEVRGAAVEALGRLGGADAVDRLKAMLADRSLHVRVKAASALLRLNDATGAPVFDELLAAAGDSAPSKLVAAEAMAVRPDAAWQSLVRGLLEAQEPDVRLAAARLLAPFDPTAAGAAFRSLQEDANPAIRDEARRLALGALRDLTVLRAGLRDADPLTRVGSADRILQLTR